MANVRKGQTAASPEWRKHLPWLKRLFWKRQRCADKTVLRRDPDAV
jgi:hypothetical protein